MAEYEVPEGMIEAAYQKAVKDWDGVVRYDPHPDIKRSEKMGIEDILRAAIRWQSENPRVPNAEQAQELYDLPCNNNDGDNEFTIAVATEWQRRMYLRSQPEVPPEVRDLLDPLDPQNNFLANQYIIEAFRRGQQSMVKKDG